MTQDLRIGVIGLGYAGTRHARALQDGRIPGARLHAVCDQDPGRAAAFPDSVHARLDDIFAEPALDAVVIATPHRSHVELCENALREGLSVLVEKPFGVHAAECRRALAAHSDAIRSAALHSATKRTETAPQEQVSARIQRSVMPLLLGVVHDYRVEPKFIWLKELIQRGELGRVVRFTWQATNFFRTEAYFQTSPWRGRFLTEGGGILVNQAPHLLDAVAWLFGVPRRLFASCGFGRYHQIEVEDDVNALLEYADGTRGNLQLSTGESPGTQRLDVSFDGGRVVVEGNEAVIQRNGEGSAAYLKRASDGRPPTTTERLRLPPHGASSLGVLQNFVAALRGQAELACPAEEALIEVELANAILWSALEQKPVDFPAPSAEFERALAALSTGEVHVPGL